MNSIFGRKFFFYMRVLYILALIVIIIVFGLSAYKILDTYLSIKYEIAPYGSATTDPSILEKSRLYDNLLTCYWVICCFCMVTFRLVAKKIKIRKAPSTLPKENAA